MHVIVPKNFESFAKWIPALSGMTAAVAVIFSTCKPIGWEYYSELPEYYQLAVRISQPTFDPVKKDTLFNPIYGWKSFYTDTTLVLIDSVHISKPGTYKAELKYKWQNADGRFTIVADFAGWNVFAKLIRFLDGEESFSQVFELKDSVYVLKFGVTDGATPETYDPSLLKDAPFD